MTVPRATLVGPVTTREIPLPIRVATVEDDERYRHSLELLFRHAPGFALAGAFASAEDALAELAGASSRGGAPGWDLVLMDLELPGLNGIEAIRRIKERLPQAAIVVLTVFEQPATVLQAICAGADGYLVKRTPPDELTLQLTAVVNGGSPLTAGVARTVLELVRRFTPAASDAPGAEPTRLDLTDREQEVLRGLVQGMSYKQVAAHLRVSLDTVRTHVRGIYRKLQVHGAAEAVRRAIEERLV
jgi:DNA-binding NarL/FixJ family response regulator